MCKATVRSLFELAVVSVIGIFPSWNNHHVMMMVIVYFIIHTCNIYHIYIYVDSSQSAGLLVQALGTSSL